MSYFWIFQFIFKFFAVSQPLFSLRFDKSDMELWLFKKYLKMNMVIGKFDNVRNSVTTLS